MTREEFAFALQIQRDAEEAAAEAMRQKAEADAAVAKFRKEEADIREGEGLVDRTIRMAEKHGALRSVPPVDNYGGFGSGTR